MKKYLLLILTQLSLFATDLLEVKLLSSENNQIKIQIINKSDKIVTFNHVTILEVTEGREDTVRFDINCPCNSKCSKAITMLYQNEKKELTWDKKDSECNLVKGTFKFVVEKNDKFIGESKKIHILK